MHMTVGEWNDFLAKTHVQANKTFFFASTRNPYERMLSAYLSKVVDAVQPHMWPPGMRSNDSFATFVELSVRSPGKQAKHPGCQHTAYADSSRREALSTLRVLGPVFVLTLLFRLESNTSVCAFFDHRQ